MGEVGDLNCWTTLDVTPDKVLAGPVGKLDCVVLFGYEHDGSEWFAASTANKEKILWMLEKAKRRLFEEADT